MLNILNVVLVETLVHDIAIFVSDQKPSEIVLAGAIELFLEHALLLKLIASIFARWNFIDVQTHAVVLSLR